MNIKQCCSKYFYIALLLPVVFLPGCGAISWIKNKLGMSSERAEHGISTNISVGDSSEVLVSIDGKAVVTVAFLETEFEKILKQNPQLKQVLPFMPDAKSNFVQGLLNQHIVDKYVQDNSIDQKIEYKQEEEEMILSVKRMLNTKYFAAAHPAQVQDADVLSYYEANKDKMQELVISRGGVQTVGVQFEKEADAKAFMAKVQGKNIADIAKANNLTDKVRDFKLVNKQSVGIDPVLRNKIVAMEKTPATEMVKISDTACWVVQVTTKEEAKYRSFEEVKEPLRSLVEREKGNEALQKAIDSLKVNMNIVINDAYFKESEQAMQQNFATMAQMAQEPEQQQVAQQQEAPKPARAV